MFNRDRLRYAQNKLGRAFDHGTAAGIPLRILILGGGIAGMAFAIRARSAGMDVAIVEADPDWRVAGAGISITGPTYRALKRIGLLPDVKQAGFFIAKGALICAADGTPVGEVPTQALEPDLPTAGGILRPELHRILSQKVSALGVPVRLGVTARTLADSGEAVDVEFSDGSKDSFEIVIGADGAFSATREMLFPEAPVPQYTGQFCWRLLARRPAEIDRPLFFVGADLTCGLMPVSQDQMYLWLLENSPERRYLDEAAVPGRLKQMLAPFGGRAIAAVREAIDAGAPIIARPLDALLLPLPWHKGRVMLIGDACHATTPHLASGAGIAIEDGMLLADMLGEGGDPEHVFDRFEARRWERCRLVVEESVGIGHMQQTHADPAELNARMSRAQAALARDI